LQHANATEFFGYDSRNLPHWMLAATGSVKVLLESACIMLLGFRVRLLGLRSAHFHVAGHRRPHLLRTLVIAVRTCCEVSRTEMAQACAKAPSTFPPSPSAPFAQSPARRRRRHSGRSLNARGVSEHCRHAHPYCFAGLVLAAAACAAVFAAAAAACAAFVRACLDCILPRDVTNV
jgi:hypothetical protein